MSKDAPESKIVLSVCKHLSSGINYVVHLNASIDDIDWMISQLQQEKDELCELIQTGKIPEYVRNRFIK